MKHVKNHSWKFIFGLKENRLVSITKNVYVKITDLDWSNTLLQKVWLKEFGYVLVAKLVITNGDIRYVATNDLSLADITTLTKHNDHRWNIETFHRGIKQTTGIEKCYSVLERSQRNHIFASFIAFIKLEYKRLKEHISWYEQKATYSRIGVRFALSA